jgi:hypothetical protein
MVDQIPSSEGAIPLFWLILFGRAPVFMLLLLGIYILGWLPPFKHGNVGLLAAFVRLADSWTTMERSFGD